MSQEKHAEFVLICNVFWEWENDAFQKKFAFDYLKYSFCFYWQKVCLELCIPTGLWRIFYIFKQLLEMHYQEAVCLLKDDSYSIFSVRGQQEDFFFSCKIKNWMLLLECKFSRRGILRFFLHFLWCLMWQGFFCLCVYVCTKLRCAWNLVKRSLSFLYAPEFHISTVQISTIKKIT